jgi:hypothetical protein
MVTRGWLVPTERGGSGGARWFKLDPATLARLQALKDRDHKAPHQRPDGLYSIRGVAAHLDISEHTVRYRIEQGWLTPDDRSGQGSPCWFELGPKTLARLQALKLKHTQKARSPHRKRARRGRAS